MLIVRRRFLSLLLPSLKRRHRADGVQRWRRISTTPRRLTLFKSEWNFDLTNDDFFTYIMGNIHPDLAEQDAIIDGVSGKTFTYAELHEKSKNIGYSMMKRGYRKNDVVAIHSPNLPEYLMTVLGCAYAGLAVTLVNPMNTVAEVVRQLDETKTKALFVFPKFGKIAFEAKESVHSVRDVIFFGAPYVAAPALKVYLNLFHNEETCWLIKDLIDVGSKGNQRFLGCPWGIELPKYNTEKDIFLLPYSSGTTGLPKGVVHTHKTVLAYIDQVVKCPKMSGLVRSGNRLLLLLPMFHNFGFNVAFAGVASGSTIITNPLFNKKLLLRSIQNYKLESLPFVPPLVKFLATEPLVSEYDMSSVQVILSGGAPLSLDTAKALVERFPHIQMRQGWGMTEGLISASVGLVNYEAPLNTLGYLFPNVSAKIFDLESGEELGKNQSGEFVVKTPSALVEYLNNPEETANAFREIDGEKWLITGDVGYFDDNEFIFLVDRIKEMIKYKGHQMSPVEIENTIMAMEGVADAAVAGVPAGDDGELPVAFVVKKKDANVTKSLVSAYIRENMAHQNHLRGGVYFIDEIPRSIAGKIQRIQLKAMAKELEGKKDET